MQFIEKNAFNVRTAVYRLRKEGAQLEFCLFPMIHAGSPEFYAEISRRLDQCDLILVEGVRSKKANVLVYSYKILKRIRRLGFVLQQDAMDLKGFGAKIVNTDIAGDAFEARWSALPILLHLQLFLLVPIYVVYLVIFANRETIAKQIAMDDLPTNEEILETGDEEWEALHTLLIDERDRTLIDHLRRLDEDKSEEFRCIGVVYGAEHMRNVIAFLMHQMNYHVAKSEWVTVFDL